MTSASGGQRSIQLSYGRYAVERGAILMMGTHLVYYFLSRRINRLFFHRFWLFLSVLFHSDWIQPSSATFDSPHSNPMMGKLDLPQSPPRMNERSFSRCDHPVMNKKERIFDAAHEVLGEQGRLALEDPDTSPLLTRGSLGAMFSTSHNEKMVEVLTGAERRRRRTPQEKIAIVQQTFEPGMTVSHVARLHDVNANQLFKWRKQFQEGSLGDHRR